MGSDTVVSADPLPYRVLKLSRETTMPLSESHAVILGGNSGIGMATARSMAECGARVTIIGRSEAKTREVAEEIGARGEVGDGREETMMTELFDRIGPLDHLVLSAAGGTGFGTVAELETHDLKQAFDEKFWVYWTVLKTALPHMARDGSVTMVGAVRSRMADPPTIGLAAVNGALDAMVRGLARGLAPLRVNLVAPGVIDTPTWAGMPEADRQALFEHYGKERIPAGRVGTTEEVAEAIVGLASNPFVTGVVLPVDGGMRL